MKKILVLGGTRFFGRKLVERLIEAGHEVTIATRGQSGNPFGEQVKHLQFDRNDKAAFEAAIAPHAFDIVYDNICYAPNQAKELCDIFNGKIEKLVFTSTLSTYEADGQVPKTEADFTPANHLLRMGEATDFTYGEGKRQCEAVFEKYATFPVVAVRFPIVMGVDDYTERLHFHVKRIIKGEPMGFVNMDAEMSFIHADEAAAFLQWAGEEAAAGPYNATAHGQISLQQLIELIEQVTKQRAKIALLGTEEIRSPYAIPASWYMTNEKATAAGFTFSTLSDWLQPLVEDIAALYKD